MSLSLSLSFLFTLVMFITPKRKSISSQNPLRFGYRLPLILLLISGSVMRMPERTSRRTFLDEVFIWNAKSFWWTLPTLTFPMSFTVRVGSHCVTSWSIRADPRVLLQHAWTLFSTSLLYSRSRYAHCCHTATCCGCAPCSEGRAS